MESSPRFEVITSPVTLTISPISTSAFQASSWVSPTLSRESITCSSVPSPSRTMAKQSFPVSRLKMIRPAIDSVFPDGVSVARSLKRSRISFRVEVRGTWTGYASTPRARSESRFSRRILNCSGRSLSVIVTRVYPFRSCTRRSPMSVKSGS